MAPLIAPDDWMNSHLSVARFYGAIIIDSSTYLVHPSSGFLVKQGLIKHIGALGFETVKKEVQRHGDSPKMTRLAKIIKARKRSEKSKELELF